MKNWKTATGLGIALLALSLVATWDEWQTKKDDKSKETENLLTAIKLEQIVAFNFFTAGDADTGGDKTTVAKPDPKNQVEVSARMSEGLWKITNPINELADQQNVKDLLKNVVDYKFETEVGSGKDQWAKFGLETPRRKLEVELVDGSKTSFFVGNNAPVGFSAYIATTASEKVFAGSQYIATSLSKKLFDFRDKKILHLLQTEIDEIDYKPAGGETISLKRSDGKWLMSAPENGQADTTVVNNFLDDLVGLRAVEFFDAPSDEQIKMFSSSKNLAEVVVNNLNSKTKSSVFLAKDAKGKFFAALEPNRRVFKVGDEFKPKLSKNLNDFRNKQIFDFKSAQVTGVSIDGKDYRLVGGDWYSSDDAGKFDKEGKFSGKEEEKPKAAQNVRGLLVDLEFARADEIIGASSPDVKKLSSSPNHLVKLKFTDPASQELDINIWLDGANSIFVRASGATKIFKAKKSIIASLTGVPTVPVEDASFQPPMEMPPMEGQ